MGYPAAIATKMLLDGEIQRKGMVLPFTQDIYRPMLKRLKAEGIIAEEKSTWLWVPDTNFSRISWLQILPLSLLINSNTHILSKYFSEQGMKG